LVGYTDGKPELNPHEVESFRWITLESLLEEISSAPEKFTVWFRIILNQHFENLKKELCHASL